MCRKNERNSTFIDNGLIASTYFIDCRYLGWISIKLLMFRFRMLESIYCCLLILGYFIIDNIIASI